jgi:predicted transposase YbfD/YdcC
LLLSLPFLTGKIITADCLHPNKDLAQIIIEKDGHYFLQVKGNKNYLFAPIKAAFPTKPPRYGPPEKGHGRIEQRAVLSLATDAMQSSFPHARSIHAVYTKGVRNGKPYENIRYFISSLIPECRTPLAWDHLVRGHWGGVENRNHWSKDAIWLEDKTRSRNPRLVGNLALIRNALLKIVADHKEAYGSLPAFTEAMREDKSEAYRLISGTL